MALPPALRSLADYLASPPGRRLEGKLIRYTGHSAYSYLFGLDRGRVGLRPASGYRPPLALTTIGNRSGRLHTVGLAYYELDGSWAVIGSAGGAETEPHWVSNARANPAAWVHLHRRTTPVLADVLEGKTKQPYWTHITARAPIFEQFQASVRRDIPIVMLRPRQPAGGSPQTSPLES